MRPIRLLPRITDLKYHIAHPWSLLIACMSILLYMVEAGSQHMLDSFPAIILSAGISAAFLFTPIAPRPGSWLTLICLLLAVIAPFPLPNVTPTLIIAIMGLFGAQGKPDVFVAVPLSMAALLYNSYTNGDTHVMDGADIFTTTVVLFTSSLVGTVFHQNHLRKQAEQQHAVDIERLRVARSLHDAVANDITRILLQVDDTDMPVNRSLLHQQLSDALDDTHRLIRTLESTDAPASTSSNWSELAHLLNDAQTQLAQAGFDGEVLIPQLDCPLSAPIIDLYTGIIREMATNIMKYADQSHPYIITLQRDRTALVLHISDVCRQPHGHDYGMTSGLKRYQQQFESLNGTVDCQCQGLKWSATFTLPMQ